MAGQVEQMSKAKFLELYSQVYGYGGTINDLRNKEFCRVKGLVLSNLLSICCVQKFFNFDFNKELQLNGI